MYSVFPKLNFLHNVQLYMTMCSGLLYEELKENQALQFNLV